MPDESGLWSNVVRPALLAYGTAKRIENVLDEGTPDVVFALHKVPGVSPVTGLLELKDVDGWPARASTPIVITHYTAAQRKWHLDWAKVDPRIYVFVRVHGTSVTYDDDLDPQGQKTPDGFFLFGAALAAQGIGVWRRDEWYRFALYHATGRLDAGRFARTLVG